ncbi:MAG: threonine synthase, partial [Oscillospiraceae bacterium]
ADNQYLIDPHTAVAFRVLEDYRRDSGDKTPTLVVSTASPFKFCDHVLGALGVTEFAAGTAIIDQLAEFTGATAPTSLRELKDKTPRFHDCTAKEQMVDKVLEMLG